MKLIYDEYMTKEEAKKIFGTVANLVNAIGTSRQNWYQYSDPLSKGTAQRIIGAAMQNGYTVPKKCLEQGDK